MRPCSCWRPWGCSSWPWWPCGCQHTGPPAWTPWWRCATTNPPVQGEKGRKDGGRKSRGRGVEEGEVAVIRRLLHRVYTCEASTWHQGPRGPWAVDSNQL